MVVVEDRATGRRSSDGARGWAVDDVAGGAVAIGRLVSTHADEFCGSYVDGAGVVVVVLAPSTNEAVWQQRLARAAGGLPFRTVRGAASAAELARLQTELRDFDWPSGRPEHGCFVDVPRCAVVVQVRSLPENDKRALARQFGALVVVDEGYRPDRR
jgi:hypothetical protein